MILQALSEYYERKRSVKGSEIAAEGWEWKELPFIIVLDGKGKFIQIEDTREENGKVRRGKRFLVPLGVKRTSGVAADLLWGSAEYIFGIGKKGSEKRTSFLDRLKAELDGIEIVECVIDFVENLPKDKLSRDKNWEEISETNPFLSFRIVSDRTLVCNRPEVDKKLSSSNGGGSTEAICLVTGEKTRIKELHKAIKGVRGVQSSGGNIISYNHNAFESYNKKRGYNAPVSDKAEFAYTTALNTLLDRDSSQRMLIGDTTAVFWSRKQTSFEKDFSQFFENPESDDPNDGAEKVRALFESVKTGAYVEDDVNTPFYVLGLAPNVARISVRFWQSGTVAEFSKRIKQYFDDFAIIKPPNRPEFYSIRSILVSVSPQNKIENISPGVAGELMYAIMTGTPYPTTLFQAAIRRIRSDAKERVNPERAAAIKAYINRYYRFYTGKNTKEISMSLDLSQPSKGYHLGRLFATLEKIQEEANRNLNATIRERFYGAACSSPVTVFSNLLRLKNYHLAKLENRGRAVQFEQLLTEIMNKLTDFPSYLDLHEQGRFAIGYYHQRQEFYNKREKVEIELESKNGNNERSENV